MFARSFSEGIRRLNRHKGLALLLYAAYLGMAFVILLPLILALREAVGISGFGPDLVQQFDAVLWADIMEKVGDVWQALPTQVLWLLPFLLLWKAAVSVGLIHALRDGGGRSFWEGIGRYTGKGALLALLFAGLALGWLIGSILFASVLAGLWPTEVGLFWGQFVLFPTVLLAGFAVLDLLHDYARIALVIGYQSVPDAAQTGLRWPWKHGTASHLYLAWYGIVLALWLLSLWADLLMPEATMGAVWLAFLVQQGFLLLRAAATVGWWGSEVAFYEQVADAARPLLAADAPADETARAMMPDVA